MDIFGLTMILRRMDPYFLLNKLGKNDHIFDQRDKDKA